MNKRSCFALLTMCLILINCQKKTVQLPLIDIPGISEIQNHSSIWVFMEANNGVTTARLNKNNKILNTHWIFNIDRRLPMKEVVPILIEMQENRNKDSMHKKEGMNNYFSYADISSEKVSLAPFTQINFKFNNDQDDFLDSINESSCSVLVKIEDQSIKINDKVIDQETLESIIKEQKTCKNYEELKVILAYDDQTLFQNYLQTKVFLIHKEILCDSIEYLYTVK
ncbi:hypothetical protein [Lutimonas vermicola]|uniref:Lipoprotein n=1 Tax=Lutimonas vermicola TaxID=414288 RepID=A0ABU9L1U8_9FLAO